MSTRPPFPQCALPSPCSDPAHAPTHLGEGAVEGGVAGQPRSRRGRLGDPLHGGGAQGAGEEEVQVQQEWQFIPCEQAVGNACAAGARRAPAAMHKQLGLGGEVCDSKRGYGGEE